jgi:hypothetical protein
MVEIKIPDGASRAQLYDNGPLADAGELSSRGGEHRCTLWFYPAPGGGRSSQDFSHFEVEDLAELHHDPLTRNEAAAAFDKWFTKHGWRPNPRDAHGDVVVAAWELP